MHALLPSEASARPASGGHVLGAGSTFKEMAQAVLSSQDASTLVEHVQGKLTAAMKRAAFNVGRWERREACGADENVAVMAASLQVTDPLSGQAFEAYLLLSLKQGPTGCLLTMKTEARGLPANQVVVRRELLLYCSWDVSTMRDMAHVFTGSLAVMAERPARVFSGTDFEMLPRQLTRALAP